MRRPVLLLLALLGLTACRDEKLRQALPPDVHVDTYFQQGASQVDVLWVVDNSGSMVPRQDNLARNFQSFIDVFSRQKIDYRVAITTTDIFKDQGQFRGSPKVLTPQTPDVVAAFAKNIKVGTGGSAYEAGLQAALMSLERQSQVNAPILEARASCEQACVGAAKETCLNGCAVKHPVEFLRKGAYLYLIFVTDEEDRSDGDIRYYWRTFETTHGVGNDGTVTTAAIIGDVPSNACGATPGARYQELSSLTGGEVGSICDAEFATTLRNLAFSAVGLKRKFALSLPPNVDTLEVSVKYPCNAVPELTEACLSVDETACTSAPAEALSKVCVPQKGGPNGWSYEAANNVVYFAGLSVPGAGTRVDLQYYEEGKP